MGTRCWEEYSLPTEVPHINIPFYLLYGHDPKLPSALDFQALVSKFPTIESKYGRELVGELKHARNMAKQNVQRKQREKKKFFDRQCKEVDLKVNDLVMLKTQPRFCLDYKYKGPFIIKAVTPTPTNVVIRLKDDSAAKNYVYLSSVYHCAVVRYHNQPHG